MPIFSSWLLVGLGITRWHEVVNGCWLCPVATVRPVIRVSDDLVGRLVVVHLLHGRAIVAVVALTPTLAKVIVMLLARVVVVIHHR